MSRVSCAQEAAVSKAARTGEWQESLAAHVAECVHCREIVQTSRWMQALAQSSEQNFVLPEAKLVWWRAQYAERRARAEKTRTVLEWLEVVSGAAVPVGLAGWVAWNWYAIQGAAAGVMIGLAPQFSLAAMSFSALVPALLFLGAISLAYPLLVRE